MRILVAFVRVVAAINRWVGLALSPERFKMLEEDAFNHYEVHCTPADTEKCESGKLIELDYIKELDKHWLE